MVVGVDGGRQKKKGGGGVEREGDESNGRRGVHVLEESGRKDGRGKCWEAGKGGRNKLTKRVNKSSEGIQKRGGE